jgi:hypothetical protein
MFCLQAEASASLRVDVAAVGRPVASRTADSRAVFKSETV